MPPTVGFGEPIFKAYIAQFPDATAAALEREALAAAKGIPVLQPAGPWTFLGNAAATFIFDPLAAPGSFNAILIQVSSYENFNLDCVEIFDTQGTVVEYASAPTYSNLVTDETKFLGPPDADPAITAAVANDECAFIFTRYTNPIDRFRINSQGLTQPAAPGDLIAVGGGGFQNPTNGNERPGGMAINGTGRIHLTLSVGDTGRLVRYDLDGSFVDDVEISTDLVAVGSGSHSVAVDSEGVIFTACSTGNGVVQVRRFEANLAVGNASGFASGFGNDRVEHNSIAVDNAGFVIVVGGMTSLISGRNHWRVKFPDTVDVVSDPPVWQSSSQLDGNNPSINTYWHAVTLGANGDIFMAGELNSGLLATIQVYTAKFDLDGDPQWDEAFDDGDAPSDVGHAIEVDASGDVYVGGMVGTDTNGKDGILRRYTSDDGTPTTNNSIILASVGDDEILDIAVEESGGTDYVYVVGYETVSGQGENMVVRKYRFDTTFNLFFPVWTRTHHGGFGNDRAVSCALSENNLVVAGYETDSGGLTKLVLRVYAK
ncbi:MAG TPA: hypothetical protein VFC90_03765 [Planctomycetota bacterium]|nr:hypothetical protein [Planctomycetota bacterium]